MARHGVLPPKIGAVRHHLARYRLSEEQAYDRADQLGEMLVLGGPPRTAVRGHKDKKSRLEMSGCI